MNPTTIRYLREFLVTQLNMLIFYPLALTLTNAGSILVTPERPRIFVWMLGGLVFMCFYFIRKYIHQFLLFICLHLTGLVIMYGVSLFLSPNDNYINKVVFLLLGFGFMIHSVYLRFATQNFEDEPIGIPFAVGFTVVALFIQHKIVGDIWDLYYKIVLIAVIAFCFVIRYLNEYTNFLMVNNSSTGIIPEKEIFNSGIKFSFIYTIFCAVILFVTSSHTWLTRLAELIKQGLINFLVFIINLFLGKEYEQLPVEGTEDGAGHFDDFMLEEIQEPSVFWKVIEILGVIAMILGIIYVSYRLIRLLIRYIQKVMKNRAEALGDFSDLQSYDIREKCETRKPKDRNKTTGRWWEIWDPAAKIRRIYKKQVVLYKPNPLTANEKQKKDPFNPEKLGIYTAKEMEIRMEIPFAKLYEKARYSQDSCTSHDVKEMKELFR